MHKFIWAFLPIATLGLTGCFHVPDDLSNSAITEVQEMDFTTVEQSSGSYAATQPALYLIQSQDQLDQLWAMHVSGNILNPSPAPHIDFGSQFVIAAFAGQKNTGGYSFQITDINTNAQSGTSDIAVYATLESPAPGMVVTQALTSPHHVVRIDRRANFQFEEVYMILTDQATSTTQVVPVNQNDF